MGFRIRIDEPGDHPRVVDVFEPIEIGRQVDGIRLFDPTVSRRHVRLEPHPEGLLIADLGSSYGTFVHGYRLAGPVLLGPGDVVYLGNSQLSVLSALTAPVPGAVPVLAHEAPPPAATPPPPPMASSGGSGFGTDDGFDLTVASAPTPLPPTDSGLTPPPPVVAGAPPLPTPAGAPGAAPPGAAVPVAPPPSAAPPPAVGSPPAVAPPPVGASVAGMPASPPVVDLGAVPTAAAMQLPGDEAPQGSPWARRPGALAVLMNLSTLLALALPVGIVRVLAEALDADLTTDELISRVVLLGRRCCCRRAACSASRRCGHRSSAVRPVPASRPRCVPGATGSWWPPGCSRRGRP
ncbi:MAG: FHA domain-containing protein [Acidimicrobiales bacterium]